MSNGQQVGGVVERVHQGKTQMWAILLNGTWYGCGRDRPNCQQGDTVTFVAVQNGRYLNVQQGSIQVTGTNQAASPQQGGQGGGGYQQRRGGAGGGGGNNYRQQAAAKDDYWTKKEERDVVTQRVIQLQSSRNSAIAAVSAALSAGAVPLPSKKAEQLEAVLSLIDLVTARYEEQAGKKAAGEQVFESSPDAQEDTAYYPPGQPQTQGNQDYDDDIPF